MKQKILLLCFSIIVSGMFSQTYAKTIEVRSLDSFSTVNPPSSITVQLLEPIEITKEEILKPGIEVKGELVDVVSPKRLKRDAGFSFRPLTYINENGQKQNLSINVKASYTQHVNKGKLTKKAALCIGNFFVKGINAGVVAVEGAVKNEKNNRLKSAGHSLYESSPVSYIEKGQEIAIKKDETFYLKFPKTIKK